MAVVGCGHHGRRPASARWHCSGCSPSSTPAPARAPRSAPPSHANGGVGGLLTRPAAATAGLRRTAAQTAADGRAASETRRRRRDRQPVPVRRRPRRPAPRAVVGRHHAPAGAVAQPRRLRRRRRDRPGRRRRHGYYDTDPQPQHQQASRVREPPRARRQGTRPGARDVQRRRPPPPAPSPTAASTSPGTPPNPTTGPPRTADHPPPPARRTRCAQPEPAADRPGPAWRGRRRGRGVPGMSVYGASATRDRHGWFFGLTGPQLVLLLAAGGPGLAGHGRRPLVSPPASWSRPGCAAALPDLRARPRLVGRPVDRRAGPPRARHARLGWTTWQLGGRHRRPGPDDRTRPTSPASWPASGSTTGRPARTHDRPAVIQNHAARTWAATARITHPGIGMADDQHPRPDGRRARRAARGRAAGGQIDHLAVQVRTVPDDGTERADGSTPTASPTNRTSLPHPRRPARATTRRRAAVRTEAFVTVVVRRARDRPSDARRAGRGLLGRARILYGTSARGRGPAGRRASAAPSVTWLDTADLAVAIRTGFEPGDAAALADADLQRRSPPRGRGRRHPARGGRAHHRRHHAARLPPRRLGVRRRHHPAAPQGRRDRRTGPGPGAVDHPANAAR